MGGAADSEVGSDLFESLAEVCLRLQGLSSFDKRELTDMRRSSLSCDIEADDFAGVYRFSVHCAGKSNDGPWYTDDSRIRFARMR